MAAVTNRAALAIRYVKPSLQITASILILMVINVLSAIAAALHGNFPGERIQFPQALRIHVR